MEEVKFVIDLVSTLEKYNIDFSFDLKADYMTACNIYYLR